MPSTEAGKRLLEFKDDLAYITLDGVNIIDAIEAEARDEGFAAGFGEALDDLHGNVAEARAALLAELEAEGVLTWGDPGHRERFLAAVGA